MKSKLQKIHIEAEVEGVTVTLNGEMDLVNIQISDEAMQMGPERLANTIKEAFSKAKKKAEQVAAENMKDIMGDMGLPGM
ncbi:hypothetical protein HON22_01480 [Candidatus Peregrinibacteria bacterium]|nr:hypothetical protein [Candidatus Peregrinibacteria bacterium]